MKHIILVLITITSLYASEAVNKDQYRTVFKVFDRVYSLVGKKATNIQFILSTGRFTVQFTMKKELTKMRMKAIKKLFHTIELDDDLMWDFKIQKK